VKQLKPQIRNANRWHVAKRLFDTEATVLYRLGNHDQIPRLLAHFEENQEFYLVQEFIEGESLSLMLPRKTWTEAQVMRRLQDLLSVLAFVHGQQIIHRDIKPSNIICRQQDNKLVLIDFGAVKQVSASFAETDQTLTISIGTQGYMASEQISGAPRFNSDIYAVGMIGIQALTGVRPNQLQRDPLTGEVLWRDIRPSIHPALADILDQMVRYHFKDRYQTVEEPLEAITALLAEWQPLPETEEESEFDIDPTVVWEDPQWPGSVRETSSQPGPADSHLATESLAVSSELPVADSADETSTSRAANQTSGQTEKQTASQASSELINQELINQNSTNQPFVQPGDTVETGTARLAPNQTYGRTQLQTGTHNTTHTFSGFRVAPWLLVLTLGGVIAAAVTLSRSIHPNPGIRSAQQTSQLSSQLSSPALNQAASPAIPNLPCRELPPPVLPSTKPNYEFADGTRYYGLMAGERPADGRGIMVFPSGSRYDGEFHNGQRNGCGTYSFANGRRYIGQFKDDQFDGLGIWLLGDGNRYVGEFKVNRCHGEGIFLFKDGRSERGTWQDGKLKNGNLSCTP
jgi:serine/threonine protein kinase